MTPEITYERISSLVDKYKLDAIAFYDEEFFADIPRAVKIAKLINGKFKWWVQARMDRLLKVDLGEMERCGLVAVQPGIESGSPRILEMIRKSETVQDFISANNRLTGTGIIPLYNYMMGFPSETKEELLQTVNLALRMLDDNPKAQISSFYVLVPYPGTELYGMGLNYGLVPPKSLEGWAMFNRQHFQTPWIQDNLEMLSSVLNSSKFIDGTRAIRRLKIAYKGIFPIPVAIGKWLGKFYRSRWSRHKFDSKLDSFISKIFLKLFSISERLRKE
jgi:radical SAM superfamily enzyme YgiQ (UPF0313 family)